MTPSMQISQPPAEIYALIIELAGVEYQHAYRQLDINTLLSLCHVSRLFHALTTPVLYSFIELPSFNAIRKLEQVRKANPQLLHHTRAIFFTSGILHIPAVWLAQMISIVQGATGLQRIYIIGTFPDAGAFCRLDGPGSLYEFAALHSSPFANDPNFTFPFRGLRKLALETVDFRNSKMLAALLGLCNLTHLAVVRLDMKQVLGIQSTGGVVQDGGSPDLFVCNLAKYITEAVSEPRVIFGMRGESSCHREALIREVSSLTPLAHRVVFAPYSIEVEGKDWFRYKILDGSLWDMEY